MKSNRSGLAPILSLFLLASLAPAAPEPVPPGPGPIAFLLHKVGTLRSEACGAGDFNKDGRMDIVAGEFLYLAPDFKPLKIRTLKGEVNEKGEGYRWDFANHPLDIDGDGRLDVVSADWFQKRVSWFRNPGDAGGEWAETVIDGTDNNETADVWDVDGDGKAREIVPATKRTTWLEVVKGADGQLTNIEHIVSAKSIAFGVGVGDVNGDGRPDLIRPGAWFEAPADPRKGEWKEHPLVLADRAGKTPQHAAQIAVYDVNADGLNDILCTAAHGYGLFWYEQKREGEAISFTQHLIDDSWTQPHNLTLADLDGDGVPELITGKRFMAHNGKDPDEYGPLGVYYYKLARGPKPEWKKYAITFNQGIGAGLNIPVVDLDGDGDLDVLVTGKWGGPVWFENKTK